MALIKLILFYFGNEKEIANYTHIHTINIVKSMQDIFIGTYMFYIIIRHSTP